MIIWLTDINSQVIPLQIWLTPNQQSKELEELLNKLLLIKQEEVDIKIFKKKMNLLIEKNKKNEALKFLPKLIQN